MPTVLDLACMAEAVYKDQTPEDCAASFDAMPPAVVVDCCALDCITTREQGGFRACVFASGDDTILSFRGTETAPEDKARSGQAPDADRPPQFDLAMRFAQEMIDTHALSPEHTYFCGHSLGGALAKYVAHALARDGWCAAAALSFNGPGLTVGPFEKALVSGMRHLAHGSAVEAGLSAVHKIVQQDDLPTDGQTQARIANVNIEGDKVSDIGDPAGQVYTLTAPPFVPPSHAKDADKADTGPLMWQNRASDLVEHELYLHSIHTLRRVLQMNLLGTKPASQIV